jgi:15-cis-phytoene synthase
MSTSDVQFQAPPGHSPRDLASAYAACTQIIRESDKDRYLASLYAPEPARHGLFALYTFSHEVARVREVVSDALPGEVRLQWWRDVIEGNGHGAVQSHPVAAALLDTVERYNLPRKALLDLIEARVFDLYDDPMPTLGDLEGYAAETSSALIRLGSLICANGADPGAAEAAGHAGVAYALTGLMRALPWHASRGQLYLPKDLLDRYGVTRDDIVSGRGGPGVHRALAEMRELARGHLDKVRALRGTIPAVAAPAFLPVALIEGYLAQMEKPGYDPLRTIITLPPWRQQWTLWRQARRAMRS